MNILRPFTPPRGVEVSFEHAHRHVYTQTEFHPTPTSTLILGRKVVVRAGERQASAEVMNLQTNLLPNLLKVRLNELRQARTATKLGHQVLQESKIESPAVVA